MYSPLPVIVSQVISLQRARETDFNFLTDIIYVQNTPELGGYNTRLAREQGHASKARTKAVYSPLIDLPPAEPTTMLTAMIEAQLLTNERGQAYTIFTNDQQLYRIVVDISWVYSELFLNLIPRPGGLHALMSFVGAVGTLMIDTGLEPNVLYTMKKLYTLTCKLVLMVVECFAMVCYIFSVSGTVCIIYSLCPSCPVQ